MSEPELVLRSALGGAKSGGFGAHGDGKRGLILTALPERCVIQVLGAPGRGDLTSRLGELARDVSHAVRIAGPSQWLLVGEAAVSGAALAGLQDQLDGRASLVDQSHGRVGIEIAGAAVEDVLCKGVGLPLDLAAFPVGKSASTLFGHVSVHLTRTADQSFEILVGRGFSVSVWEDLIHMALEFGVEAVALPAR